MHYDRLMRTLQCITTVTPTLQRYDRLLHVRILPRITIGTRRLPRITIGTRRLPRITIGARMLPRITIGTRTLPRITTDFYARTPAQHL